MTVTAETRARLRSHLGRYGITVPAVGARVLDCPSREARAHLESLVAERFAFRHTAGTATYYSSSPRPFSRPELRRQFAMLWLCTMERVRRKLLLPEEVRAFADDAAQFLQVKLRREFCYVEDQRLYVVRVAPRTDDLQQVFASLQRTVLARSFQPWLLLARGKLASLTVLVEGPDACAELRLWLERRPLVGTLEGAELHNSAAPMPVVVLELRSLRGAP